MDEAPSGSPKYERPALCRLCKCPVVGDTGVRMSEVDASKLAEWSLQVLQTELEEERPQEHFICQFCIADAMFQGEHIKMDDCDWWTGLKKDRLFEIFFFRDAIKPFEIKILALNHEENGAEDRIVCDSEAGATGSKYYAAPRPTKCVFCSVRFSSVSAAHWHVLETHKDKISLFCCTCRLYFVNSHELKLHRKTRHAKQLTCHLCSQLVRWFEMRDHIFKNHYDSSNNVGECCGQRFSSVITLYEHMNAETTQKKVECVYCKESVLFGTLGVHIRSNHEAVAIKCFYVTCGKYFLNEEEKDQHILKRHENNPEFVQCVYCSCKFDKKSILLHVQHRHKSQAIKCNFIRNCTKFFLTLEEREQHILDVHMARRKVIQRDSFKCVYCGKIYDLRSALVSHVSNIHRSKKIICRIRSCSEYFLSESDLKIHMLEKHSLEEKDLLKCPKCVFKTHNKECFQKHLDYAHGTETPFCQICKKQFASLLALKSHNTSVHKNTILCVHCKANVKHFHHHMTVIPCVNCNLLSPCRGLMMPHKLACKKAANTKK